MFNDGERNTGWGRLCGGEPSTGRQLRLLVLTLQAELRVASRDPVLHLLQVLVRPTLELSASEQNQDHQLQDGRRRPGDGSGCPFKMKANFLLVSQMKNNEMVQGSSGQMLDPPSAGSSQSSSDPAEAFHSFHSECSAVTSTF